MENIVCSFWPLSFICTSLNPLHFFAKAAMATTFHFLHASCPKLWTHLTAAYPETTSMLPVLLVLLCLSTMSFQSWSLEIREQHLYSKLRPGKILWGSLFMTGEVALVPGAVLGRSLFSFGVIQKKPAAFSPQFSVSLLNITAI